MKIRNTHGTPVTDEIGRIAVKVEKNIPIPAGPIHGNVRYPWDSMEIGDSFLFPSHVSKQYCYASHYPWGKKLGKKFTVKNTPKGCRCWRIE